MYVSEGNLTQQYICDYLSLKEVTHDSAVLVNLFLHRMSVDGGFHARVVSAVLAHDSDRDLMLNLLNEYAGQNEGRKDLKTWLFSEYSKAKEANDEYRVAALSAIIQSEMTGINKTAEIVAAAHSNIPQTAWQLETRKITVNEINNPDMYLAFGKRPVWGVFPLDDYVAYLSRCEELSGEEVFDCILCACAAWFSTLSREEKIVWLNMPRVSPEEWNKITEPLLSCVVSKPALMTAEWLCASGNFDAALDLYANITLAYSNTSAEKPAFEKMGEILSEFKDYDYAFESYKNAFMLNTNRKSYENAKGLLYLCETGEKLGEDMGEYYIRISKIADELAFESRIRLYWDLAVSLRGNKNYAEEYSYLEKIISEEGVCEEIFSKATARIAEINDCLDVLGKPDEMLLSMRDEQVRRSELISRGDAAYFGFDPVCALFWYNRCDAPAEKKFPAALAAGLYSAANELADTPAMKAAVLAIEGEEPAVIAHELNKAIFEALAKNEDATGILEPVYLILSAEKREVLTQFLSNRTTRNDEKAGVCKSIGKVYVSLGDVPAARSAFRAAIRSNPSNNLRSIVFSDLGSLEFEAGVYDAAKDAFYAAIKINEKFPAAWAGVAKACVCLKRFDEAKKAADKAVYYNSANESYRILREEIGKIIE